MQLRQVGGAFRLSQWAAAAVLGTGVMAGCAGGWIADSGLSGAGGGATGAGEGSGAGAGTGSGSGAGTGAGAGAGTGTGTGTGTGAGGSAPAAGGCLPLAEYFADKMYKPVLMVTCAPCHSAQQVPAFPMDQGVDPAYMAAVVEAKKVVNNGPSALVANPTQAAGVKHGGGKVLAADSAEAKTLEAFATAVMAGKDCAVPPS